MVICFVFTIATGLSFYALPLYLNVLTKSGGFSLTTVSYAVSAFFLVSAVVNVPLGRLLQRVQPRWIMLAGSVAAGCSLVFLGHVDTVWQLYLAFTVFGCGFSASSYLPGTAVIVQLFERDRVKALAVALTGGSVGGVVIAPVLNRILDVYGLVGAAPWLGLSYLALTGIPVVLAIRGQLSAHAAVRVGTAPVPVSGMRYPQAVRSAAFTAITVCFAVLMADQVGTQVQIVSIGLGKSVADAGIAVSLMASSSILGRLSGALVIARLRVIVLTAAMGLLQALAFAAFALIPGFAGLVMATVLFGITIGNLTVLIPLVVVEMFGTADYPRIYSVVQLGSSAGTAAGPALLASLHGSFGSYRMPLLILAAASAVTALVIARQRSLAEKESRAHTPSRAAIDREGGGMRCQSRKLRRYPARRS
jgi:MFS family permease